MRARYGMDRSTWRTTALVILVVALFLGAIAWVTTNMGREAAQYRLLTWDVTSPTTVDVEFEVRNPTSEPAYCVIRAQDENHIDLGYSVVSVEPVSDYTRVPYELVTLAPAFAVELLGCEIGVEPSVTPPNFPPAVPRSTSPLPLS